MGFSSQAGHVAFRTQSAPDTFPADFVAESVAMRLRTGSLTTNRDLLVPDPEIGGGRDIADAYLGAAAWSGDYEFYARVRSLPTILRAALGTAVVGPAGTQEVNTLTATGTVTGGTFTLTYNSQVTAAIAWNATAATVQAALEALSNIAPGDVIVTGGPFPGAAIVITFGGTLNGLPTGAPITVQAGSLTGTTPGATITRTITGASVTGSGFLHTIYPSDAAQLPFLGIEERIGAGLEVFHYTDAVINTLHFECDANGYLMGTAGVIARKQEAGATPLTPAQVAAKIDETAMIVGTNISMTYNGVSLPAKSFNFDLTNNFEDDDFRLGSFYLGDLTPKRREATVGVTVREASSSLWRQGSYGSSAATTPGGLITKQGLVITMATYEALPGVAPTSTYMLTLSFPKAALQPYTLDASGDDVIESDLTFQILRPEQYRPLMYAYVQNDVNTIK
jgi:hypothetical protein